MGSIGEFLTTEQIALKKGFSPSYIKKAVHKYGLPCYRFGRLLKFKECEFDEWAAQRRQQVS